MKKVVSLVLAITIVLSMISQMNHLASADNVYIYNNFIYKYIEGGISIQKYDGYNVKSITVPSSINGTPVIKIAEQAFSAQRELNNISLPNSIRIIEKNAFYMTAYQANKNNWKNNALYIGDFLIEVEEDLTGDYTVLPNTKIIAASAFYGQEKLLSISLPNGLKSICREAFSYCSNIQRINIPNSVVYIGDSAFRNCKSIQTLILPDGIEKIDEFCFASCESLSRFVFGKNVKSIGRAAFNRCKALTDLTIPDSVTSIGVEAFDGCKQLSKIVMSNNITNIKRDAFNGTSYLNNKNNWENGALYLGCSLIGIDSDTIPVNYIIKSGTKAVIERAFAYNQRINSVEFPGDVKSIPEWCFYSANKLKQVTLPNNLESIEEKAFSGCTSLLNISFPDNLKYIEEEAFCGCSSLTNISFPASLISIFREAFYGCNSILKIHFNNSDCYIDTNVWYIGGRTLPDTATIYAHDNSTAYYYAKSYNNPFVSFCKYVYKETKKATLSKDGGIYYQCEICGNTKLSKIYYPKHIKLSKAVFNFNKKEQKPKVNVVGSDGKVIDSKNYNIIYSKGCKNIGKYKVTVKFKGNYSGTKTLTFSIVPTGTSLTKLTAGKKAFSAQWKKAGFTGYQIQYGLKSNFKGAKTLTVKSNKTLKTTLKKLSAKKVYYVRIRTYKTVSKVNYFSTWSKTYKVKTK